MQRVREALDESPSPNRLPLVQRPLRLSNWLSTQRRMRTLMCTAYARHLQYKSYGALLLWSGDDQRNRLRWFHYHLC